MRRTFHYVSCGLTVASEIEIPGFPSAAPEKTPDLFVSVRDRAVPRKSRDVERTRYVSPECDGDGSPQLTVWTASTGAHRFRYHDGTEFVIDRAATRVEAHWEEPLTEADTAVYLLGPVLGFIMRLRDIVPLHASAVMIGERAVAFVGDAWAGKSTTAAAFASLGHAVLSDDLLPIAHINGAILAYPSHPRLTMWPDSARALFGATEDLPALTPTYDKRYIDLQNGDRFQSTPVPLEVIYVLGARGTDLETMRIETIRPQNALMSLVSNTYGNYLLDSAMRAVEFDLLSRVVEHVPVRHVTFAHDIEQLRDSCIWLAQLVTQERMEEQV